MKNMLNKLFLLSKLSDSAHRTYKNFLINKTFLTTTQIFLVQSSIKIF